MANYFRKRSVIQEALEPDQGAAELDIGQAGELATAKLLACAAWQSAATTVVQVFCCERRKGLNKEEGMGYLRSGFLAPVKVRLRHPNFYHRAMNPSLFLSQK